MSRPSRNRPPRLEPVRREPEPAPPPTAVQLLRRNRVAGPLRSPGPTELRHLVSGVASADRSVLLGLAPFEGCTVEEVRAVLLSRWGASPERPETDPELTLASTAEAADRLASMSCARARITFATSRPASLLPLLGHLARLARGVGAELAEEPDSPRFRCDGRAGRVLRWVGGVAVVSDGRSVLATDDRAAAEFQRLHAMRLRVGTLDLRIAAIVLARGARLLTRNRTDFRRVHGLNAEDWTI